MSSRGQAVYNASRSFPSRRRKKSRFSLNPKVAQARAQAVANQIAMGAMMRGSELKGVDQPLTGLTGITSPLVSTITTNDGGTANPLLIQQGAAGYQRIGRKINVKSMRITGLLTLAAAAGTGNCDAVTVRMVVVKDEKPGDTVPNFQDLFSVTQADGTKTSFVFAPLNQNITDNVRIIRDRKITLVPQRNTAVGSRQAQHFVDEYIPLRNMEVQYSGTADPLTLANITSNAVYVYMLVDSGVTAGAVSLEDLSSRVRYVG
uniref:Putative capsid protein n=1 Tax=Cygnus columbianus CRESS-DNA-virus sp. TaxID=2815027 RepID=A0A8A4XCD0_9VIRU|nr:MAG: putative capsid protein [Cygnus columbianus CRESS-DNA-virus sp.]